MTCDACGEKPKKMNKGFPKAVVEINNPETLVLLRKVVIPASMGDETAFPPAIGKYFNVLLHYDASGNNYLYSSDGIPTEIGSNIPSEVLDRINTLEDGYDDLTEDYGQLQSEVGDISEDLSAETSARELADGNLQTQIDAITASSDVKDVVGTKAELNNYDTSALGNNDIIKVLQDESENNATTYYRWNATTQQFALIGEEGPYYTKAATDTLLNAKQNVLTAGTGIDITNNVISATGGGGGTSDYEDLNNLPKVNNVTLTGNKSLSDLGIQPAGNYITKAVDDLENYYKKSETYTQTEINNLISAISTMSLEVVQTLPTQDISTTTIYLVPKQTAGTNDAYDEYIYVSNNWEHIGSTDIDLTNYVTNTDYATSSVGGVVKVSAGDYGLNMDSGVLKGVVKTVSQYNDMSSKGVVCKGTLENVLTDRIGDIDTILTRLTTGGGVS